MQFTFARHIARGQLADLASLDWRDRCTEDRFWFKIKVTSGKMAFAKVNKAIASAGKKNAFPSNGTSEDPC
jgi:hypothetical protein